MSREDIVCALKSSTIATVDTTHISESNSPIGKVFGISEILKDWLYSHTKPKRKVVAEEIETDWKPKKNPQ